MLPILVRLERARAVPSGIAVGSLPILQVFYLWWPDGARYLERQLTVRTAAELERIQQLRDRASGGYIWVIPERWGISRADIDSVSSRDDGDMPDRLEEYDDPFDSN